MDIHVYFHDGPDARVTRQLAEILTRLGVVTTQGEQMAKTFAEVKADLATLTTNVQELIREVGVLVAAGPGVITQAQLDELDTAIKAVSDAAAAADPNPSGGM